MAEGLPIDQVPVVQELLEPLGLLKLKKQHNQVARKLAKPPRCQPETQSRTVVTPIVSKIAKNLFRGTLEMAGNASDDVFEAAYRLSQSLFKGHHYDPESMVWGDPILPGLKYYSSVMLDGIIYEVFLYLFDCPLLTYDYSDW